MKPIPILLLTLAVSISAAAQEPVYNQLDPRAYDPAVDPDIGLFISDWRHSMPRHIMGNLVIRDVLTRLEGDPLQPSHPGAVLQYLSLFARGDLAAGTVTRSIALDGEQEVFFVVSGEGRIETAKTSADLRYGIFVFVPAGIGHRLVNTGGEPLVMYLMRERTPDGFVPRDDILVRDYADTPIGYVNGHWANIHKNMFGPSDGLAVISGLGPVVYAPGTICQPHTHGEGAEECWVVLRGNPTLLMGKEIRVLSPGMGFKNPPSGMCPYGPINNGAEPVMMFYVGAPQGE